MTLEGLAQVGIEHWVIDGEATVIEQCNENRAHLQKSRPPEVANAAIVQIDRESVGNRSDFSCDLDGLTEDVIDLAAQFDRDLSTDAHGERPIHRLGVHHGNESGAGDPLIEQGTQDAGAIAGRAAVNRIAGVRQDNQATFRFHRAAHRLCG